MARLLTPNMLDAKTPPDVNVQPDAREPVIDPTLGITVNVNKQGTPRHRLVTIGDSLTHGFQSGAIFNTRLSYPNIIAREMGWNQLRYPTMRGQETDLPINLEHLARQLDQKFGETIDWWEFPSFLSFVRNYLDEVEDYWERECWFYSTRSKKTDKPQLSRLWMGSTEYPLTDSTNLPKNY
jgi:hypothetical protein